MPAWGSFLILSAGGFFAVLTGLQLWEFGPPWGETAAPDLRHFGYTPIQIERFLERIGAEGRAMFFGLFRKIDMVFPVLFAASLLVMFRALHPRMAGVRIGFFAVLVLCYLVADLLENRFLWSLQASPDFEHTVRMASTMTLVKYGSLVATAALFALAAAIRVSKGTP